MYDSIIPYRSYHIIYRCKMLKVMTPREWNNGVHKHSSGQPLKLVGTKYTPQKNKMTQLKLITPFYSARSVYCMRLRVRTICNFSLCSSWWYSGPSINEGDDTTHNIGPVPDFLRGLTHGKYVPFKCKAIII